MSFEDLQNGTNGMKNLFGIVVVFAALCCSAAVPKISGVVTDLNGNPIPNSTVVVENKATHERISLQTDKHGRFAVRNLKGRDYSIFVVADSAQTGFRLNLDREDPPRSHGHVVRKVASQKALFAPHDAARGH